MKKQISKYAGACLIALLINTNAGLSFSAQPLPPLAIKDAIKIMGIDKPHKNFKYSKKTIEGNRVTYKDLVFEKGSKAKSMIINISPIDNLVDINISDLIFSDKDNFGTIKNLKLHFDEDIRIINPEAKDFAKIFNNEKGSFIGDIEMQNASITNKKDKLTFNVGNFSLNDVRALKDNFKFEQAIATNITLPIEDVNISLEKFELKGLNDYFFKKISENKDKDIDAKLDKGMVNSGLDELKEIAFEKIQFSGLKIAPTKNANSKLAQNFKSFELANFEINDFNKNMIGKFAIEGLMGKFALEDEGALMRLDELSFAKLNLDFFGAILSAYIKSDEGKSDEELKKIKLADIYKGGPLDPALRDFKIRGLELSGAGALVNLDNLSINIKEDANGIVTKYDWPQTNINVKATDKSKPMGMILGMGLETIGLDEIVISMGANADYDPNSDIGSFDKFYIDWKDFGAIHANAKSIGQMAWLKKTSIYDLKMAVKTSSKISVEKDGEAKMPADFSKFNELMAIYNGMKLLSANFEIIDHGGLNKMALKTALMDNTSAKQVRTQWAESLIKESANKKNSITKRKISASFAQFIQTGGTFALRLKNDAGVDLSQLMNSNQDLTKLGVTIENKK